MAAAIEVQAGNLKRPLVVLIAEDEILIRWALADELRGFGWDIIEVATADDAIEVLQTAIEVDLVVADVNMPGRANGFDLAAFVIRERPWVKVVIMSGHARPQDRSERLFDIFVAKPFDERELGEQLRSLLVGNTGAD
ncbi:response regulator [Allomesorhizobium alhagi]|jgi:two-component system, response regulator PdtaR|uniref:Response regulator receiver n=1 Tax=Mesorhizobium alhagi CCNWXJ12-2 TaxID=1107882 RepID=H0I2Q9_9HYPH|nr:response regulator [Mesorhizobium alhagi]EHK52758.1 response regulator receiver [Mesorhizobium alhagi CCNWXJ12-2]